MAKLVKLQKNIGGVKTQLYPETTIPQVVGLNDALAAKAAAADLTAHTGNANIHVTAQDKSGWNAKPTTSEMNAAIAEGQVFRDTIIAADLEDQASWNTEDVYLVGNDTSGYHRYEYVYEDADKESGSWTDLGSTGDISLANYYTKDETDGAIEDAIATQAEADADVYATKEEVAGLVKVYYGSSTPSWSDGDYWYEETGTV
jgi:hypothetical protein